MKKKQIWADGKFVNQSDAVIPISTGALHYGTSVFDGILCIDIENNKSSIFRLDEHIDRFLNACKILNIDTHYSHEDIVNGIKRTIVKNKLKSCYIRPITFKDTDYKELNPRKASSKLFIDVKKFRKHLFILNMKRAAKLRIDNKIKILRNGTLSKAKISGRYVKNAVIYGKAKGEGYDDAVVTDEKNNVLESTSSNIFIIKGEKVFTPKLNSFYKGITRDSVIRILKDLGYHVIETKMNKNMLFQADEMFLTSTAKGIASVKSIDGQKIKNRKVADRLRKVYIDTITGKVEKYSNWLTIIANK